eukprot:6366343-Amphidinium_carterae.1
MATPEERLLMVEQQMQAVMQRNAMLEGQVAAMQQPAQGVQQQPQMAAAIDTIERTVEQSQKGSCKRWMK